MESEGRERRWKGEEEVSIGEGVRKEEERGGKQNGGKGVEGGRRDGKKGREEEECRKEVNKGRVEEECGKE